METDRPLALREAIMRCRNGGTVSIAGVYGGFMDKFPIGLGHEPLADDQARARPTCSATCGRCSSASRRARSTRASSSRTGMPLDDAPRGYEMFMNKQDECLKVVLKA